MIGAVDVGLDGVDVDLRFCFVFVVSSLCLTALVWSLVLRLFCTN